MLALGRGFGDTFGMVEKITVKQLAALQPTELAPPPPPPRAVRLTGNLGHLVVVAANALPVLDSGLVPEEVPSYIENLQAGQRISPAGGQFHLLLVRHNNAPDFSEQTGELRIEVGNGESALMSLIRKALESATDQPLPPESSE